MDTNEWRALRRSFCAITLRLKLRDRCINPWLMHTECSTNGGATWNAAYSVYFTTDIIPPECDQGPGLPPACPAENCDGSITGRAFLRPVYSGDDQGNVCHESSNCVMSAGDISGFDDAELIEYTGTVNNCTVESSAYFPPSAEQSNCVSSGGNSWCTEPDLADEACGYFNDDYLCLETVPDGGCTFFGNGDMACASNATSPPAPDDGVTPGNVASPDNTVNLNGDTTNIFGSGTAAGSTEPTSGGEQNDGPAETQEETEIDFSDIIEQAPDDPGYDETINDLTTDTEADIDGVINELADPHDFIAPGLTLDGTIINSLTGSACSDIVIPFPGGAGGSGSATIGCDDLANLRAVLGWVLKVILAMYFFDAIMTRPK